MKKTVKARAHYGASSLNLTIPAEIKRKYKVNVGDIFEITEIEEDGTLVLQYKKVYSTK
jgi:hypothetical protein